MIRRVFASAFALAMIGTSSTAQTIENAQTYTFRIGDIVATTISDGAYRASPQPLYAPTAAPEDVNAALRARGRPTDEMPVYFSPLLLRISERLVLIDAGAGRSLGPSLGRLADRLREIGINPETIDDILITHAHLDHVGGLFDEDARPVFSNATMHLHEAERNYWINSPALSGMLVPEAFKDNFRRTATSALSAYGDRTMLFSWGDEVVPGITAFGLAGHTPGHTGFAIRSGGDELIHVGDLFFDEAFDLAHPSWRTAFDSDPAAAAEARKAFLKQASENRTRIFAYHIAFPSVGRVKADGSGYRWLAEQWEFTPTE